MEEGRSSGPLASILATRSSIQAGISGRRDDTRGGASMMWATSRLPEASLTKTWRPVASSNITQPSA